MHPTLPYLLGGDFPVLYRGQLKTLQVNLGYRCNQSCVHCHVNAGPKRTEVMEEKTIHQVIAFIERSSIANLDLTGGAPELHPNFAYLIDEARSRRINVIDRCNLTILNEPDQEYLAEFLATRCVEIVASLPCYLRENVDRQRGNGVFDGSIRALRRLNQLGYGRSSTGLKLSLVYNPQDASLPPSQEELERDYRQRLGDDYGVEFTELLTITNMPIQRFGSQLLSKGQFEEYLRLLKSAHRPENIKHVMCKTLISVDWRGYVYDCDFNQMLNLPLGGMAIPPRHVADLNDKELNGRPISIAQHCYGCTAGQGSSCGGALS